MVVFRIIWIEIKLEIPSGVVLHPSLAGQLIDRVVGKNMSTDQAMQESTNKWAEIAGQLIDRVVGKNMSMTYDFQQLTIDMPKAEGPGGHIGSVQWTINGKITITCEAYEKSPG